MNILNYVLFIVNFYLIKLDFLIQQTYTPSTAILAI